MKLILSDCPLQIDTSHYTDVKWIDLSRLKISNCVGCFGCWTKTPGRCVIRDDAVKVYPLIAGSEAVLYVSRILDGETHHIQRRVVPKNAVILAYGDPDEEEREIFRQVIARNARNMNFETYRVVFCREEQVQDFVEKELKAWGI